jgi:hypothetical protein
MHLCHFEDRCSVHLRDATLPANVSYNMLLSSYKNIRSSILLIFHELELFLKMSYILKRREIL